MVENRKGEEQGCIPDSESSQLIDTEIVIGSRESALVKMIMQHAVTETGGNKKVIREELFFMDCPIPFSMRALCHLLSETFPSVSSIASATKVGQVPLRKYLEKDLGLRVDKETRAKCHINCSKNYVCQEIPEAKQQEELPQGDLMAGQFVWAPSSQLLESPTRLVSYILGQVIPGSRPSPQPPPQGINVLAKAAVPQMHPSSPQPTSGAIPLDGKDLLASIKLSGSLDPSRERECQGEDVAPPERHASSSKDFTAAPDTTPLSACWLPVRRLDTLDLIWAQAGSLIWHLPAPKGLIELQAACNSSNKVSTNHESKSAAPRSRRGREIKSGSSEASPLKTDMMQRAGAMTEMKARVKPQDSEGKMRNQGHCTSKEEEMLQKAAILKALQKLRPHATASDVDRYLDHMEIRQRKSSPVKDKVFHLASQNGNKKCRSYLEAAEAINQLLYTEYQSGTSEYASAPIASPGRRKNDNIGQTHDPSPAVVNRKSTRGRELSAEGKCSRPSKKTLSSESRKRNQVNEQVLLPAVQKEKRARRNSSLACADLVNGDKELGILEGCDNTEKESKKHKKSLNTEGGGPLQISQNRGSNLPLQKGKSSGKGKSKTGSIGVACGPVPTSSCLQSLVNVELMMIRVGNHLSDVLAAIKDSPPIPLPSDLHRLHAAAVALVLSMNALSNKGISHLLGKGHCQEQSGEPDIVPSSQPPPPSLPLLAGSISLLTQEELILIAQELGHDDSYTFESRGCALRIELLLLAVKALSGESGIEEKDNPMLPKTLASQPTPSIVHISSKGCIDSSPSADELLTTYRNMGNLQLPQGGKTLLTLGACLEAARKGVVAMTPVSGCSFSLEPHTALQSRVTGQLMCVFQRAVDEGGASGFESLCLASNAFNRGSSSNKIAQEDESAPADVILVLMEAVNDVKEKLGQSIPNNLEAQGLAVGIALHAAGHTNLEEGIAQALFLIHSPSWTLPLNIAIAAVCSGLHASTSPGHLALTLLKDLLLLSNCVITTD